MLGFSAGAPSLCQIALAVLENFTDHRGHTSRIPRDVAHHTRKLNEIRHGTGVAPRSPQEVAVPEFVIKGLFAPAARDPRLIPEVHRYCDEWCARCPVRDRCLVARGIDIYRKARKRSASEATFADAAEALEFRREIAMTEGSPVPEQDADGMGARSMARANGREPLTERAWEYALGVSLWLVFTPAEIQRFAQSVTPVPEEVVLWHHLRIYMRLVRASAARDRAHVTNAVDLDRANGCAKVSLVSVQRSRQALLQIKRRGASQAGSLLPLLDAIERGIDEQFPQARAFIRVGLDVPAA